MGNWKRAPAIVTKNKKRDISKIVKFNDVAYTAPTPNIAECIKPVHSILKVPSGEIL